MRRKVTTWFAVMLIALGILDLFTSRTDAGWTFYTPYSSMWRPSGMGWATFSGLGFPLTLRFGDAMLIIGGVIVTLMQAPRRIAGLALSCYVIGLAVGVAPSLILASQSPSRYHYYYFSPETEFAKGAPDWPVAALVFLGSALSVAPTLIARKKRERDGDPNQPPVS